MMLAVIELLAQILCGTAAFALFRYWAKGVQPLRAGMMLTFPALNGIGLVMTGPGAAASKAAGMLPMIGVNGAMCLLLIGLACSNRSIGRTGISLMLILITLTIWGTAFALDPRIAVANFAYVIGGWAAIAVIASFLLWPSETLPATRRPRLCELLRDPFIAWFAVILTGFLLLAGWLRGYDERIGQLSALPILPVMGIITLVVERKQTILRQFMPTVLLGPVVAMSFVAAAQTFVGLNGALEWYRPDWLPRWVVESAVILLPGWTLCALAITCLAFVVERLQRVAPAR